MDGAVAARLNALQEAFARFRDCVAALPGERFLERMNGWSPRDVTAHLIGWNRYTVEGCRETRQARALPAAGRTS